jgi:hypothetical protein
MMKGLHGEHMGRYSHILIEIKKIATLHGGISFCHESHRSNTEADLLARYATSLPSGRHVWLNNVPDGIQFPLNILENAE